MNGNFWPVILLEASFRFGSRAGVCDRASTHHWTTGTRVLAISLSIPRAAKPGSTKTLVQRHGILVLFTNLSTEAALPIQITK